MKQNIVNTILSSENLVEMSSDKSKADIKPNEGPVLCKFIDDSGVDITQQVSQVRSNIL